MAANGGVKSWRLRNSIVFVQLPIATHLPSDLRVDGYLLTCLPRGPRAARGHCRLHAAVQLLKIGFHHLSVGPL